MRKVIVSLVAVLGLAAAFAVSAPDARAADYGKCNFDSECNGKKCSGGTCK